MIRFSKHVFFSVTLFCLFLIAPLCGQHGVIREYASLDPRPDATALEPLIDGQLTDASICQGPDGAYYLTGSEVKGEKAVFSRQVTFWRSSDLTAWQEVRTIELTEAVRSPEIQFQDQSFWVAVEFQKGGTGLVRFGNGNLKASDFKLQRVTDRGETPSLFRDEDGTYYWVMGAGEVARMKANPAEGLATEPVSVITPLEGDIRSHDMRGAHLAKINGYYHIFVAERRLRHGDLGRLGLPGGTDDTFVASSLKPDSGFGEARYLAFPHAGQTTLFRGPNGEWWATFSCTDSRGVFRLKPGAFKVEIVDASQPVWATGFDFDKTDAPVSYLPAAVMLRPDSSHVYERGVGFLKAVSMEKPPGQQVEYAWIRDTSITRGGDGVYYMAGTSGNLDSVHLWRSTDLEHFEYLTAAFTFDENDPALWYNQTPGRLLWAPEIHYLNDNYWIPFSVNRRLGMGLLKSSTGRPEGPYVSTYEGNRAFVAPNIDASLFVDEDGTPYFVWQGRFLRKLKQDFSDFDGEAVELKTVDGEQVGYEGIFLRKIGPWYVVLAAEWNGGTNRQDGTYDMMYAASKSLSGPYTRRRVAVSHGGHSTLFQDDKGNWHLAFFGNDRTAPFRSSPGIVALDIQDSGDDIIIGPKTDSAGRAIK